jgi:DHA2 family multidrug resistance protein
LLVLVMCCWEIMLSKGKEWDWLGDPFGRLQTLLILCVVGLVLLIVREMRCAHPIIDFRALGERNFAMSCIIMFSTMVVVYCGSIALPMLLQALMGYDALASGLVMSPSGVSCLAAMVVVGILLGRQVDARWLIAGGLVVMAAAVAGTAECQISPTHVVWPWMLMALGGCCSPGQWRLALAICAGGGAAQPARTEGGSVGTSWPDHRGSAQHHTAWANSSTA